VNSQQRPARPAATDRAPAVLAGKQHLVVVPGHPEDDPDPALGVVEALTWDAIRGVLAVVLPACERGQRTELLASGTPLVAGRSVRLAMADPLAAGNLGGDLGQLAATAALIFKLARRITNNLPTWVAESTSADS